MLSSTTKTLIKCDDTPSSADCIDPGMVKVKEEYFYDCAHISHVKTEQDIKKEYFCKNESRDYVKKKRFFFLFYCISG